MPKRRANERGGRERLVRRHLYLVLDDWSRGYAIRKIDLFPDPDACYLAQQIVTGDYVGKERLPAPIIRVDAARGLPKHLVASGQHLMFMQASDSWKEESTFKIFPIVDVTMRSTSFCCLPIDFPNCMPIDFPGDPIYITAGGSIYILDRNCFFVLSPASSPFDPLRSSPVPSDLQKLNMLPNPPFERKHVLSYAYYAHSLIFAATLKDDAFIFTFNIMEGSWNQMATEFCFRQIHFDPLLEAFVGLSLFEEGYICLQYMDGSLKCSKEKLFSKATPTEKQVGATLVYLGGRSNFCLVESISNDQTRCNNVDSVHCCHLFRLTPFFLKYDKNGDLLVVNQPVQYYDAPQGVTESALNNPAAFWM